MSIARQAAVRYRGVPIFQHLRPTAVLALVLLVIAFPLFGSGAENRFEFASGVGTNLNHLGTAEGILLGAWTTGLSPLLDLRIEPNVELIAARLGQSMLIGGVSPVLRIGIHGRRVNPFLEAGVGVSVGTRENLLNDTFGSPFFFSPMAGAGFKFGQSMAGPSLFMRWLHHSNAGLFPPNQGIDSVYVLFGYRF
jgi:Lipid A 3-O-deacylase (PagL)